MYFFYELSLNTTNCIKMIRTAPISFKCFINELSFPRSNYRIGCILKLCIITDCRFYTLTNLLYLVSNKLYGNDGLFLWSFEIDQDQLFWTVCIQFYANSCIFLVHLILLNNFHTPCINYSLYSAKYGEQYIIYNKSSIYQYILRWNIPYI